MHCAGGCLARLRSVRLCRRRDAFYRWRNNIIPGFCPGRLVPPTANVTAPSSGESHRRRCAGRVPAAWRRPRPSAGIPRGYWVSACCAFSPVSAIRMLARQTIWWLRLPAVACALVLVVAGHLAHCVERAERHAEADMAAGEAARFTAPRACLGAAALATPTRCEPSQLGHSGAKRAFLDLQRPGPSEGRLFLGGFRATSQRRVGQLAKGAAALPARITSPRTRIGR
jgi:hypothetical protein